MNLVADEGVDRAIVDRLRRDGHHVVYFAETKPAATDATVLETANQRRSLLLTLDKDFGELVFRQHQVHSGVLLIRLAGLTEENKADSVSKLLAEKRDQLTGAFSVLTPGMVRIRTL